MDPVILAKNWSKAPGAGFKKETHNGPFPGGQDLIGSRGHYAENKVLLAAPAASL